MGGGAFLIGRGVADSKAGTSGGFVVFMLV